jgi:mannose-6-phosphate isomerase
MSARTRTTSPGWPRGRPLAEVCREFPRELDGDPPPADPTFPLLVKRPDCRDLFPIRVHPTDGPARELANERFGKTEAWVVPHADPGGVYAGFKPGVTQADVDRHLAAGTPETCPHSFTPEPEDLPRVRPQPIATP